MTTHPAIKGVAVEDDTNYLYKNKCINNYKHLALGPLNCYVLTLRAIAIAASSSNLWKPRWGSNNVKQRKREKNWKNQCLITN